MEPVGLRRELALGSPTSFLEAAAASHRRRPSSRSCGGSARTCSPERASAQCACAERVCPHLRASPLPPATAAVSGPSRASRVEPIMARCGGPGPCRALLALLLPSLLLSGAVAASEGRSIHGEGGQGGSPGKKDKEKKGKAGWLRGPSLADPWGILGFWGVCALNPEPDPLLETPLAWGCVAWRS